MYEIICVNDAILAAVIKDGRKPSRIFHLLRNLVDFIRDFISQFGYLPRFQGISLKSFIYTGVSFLALPPRMKPLPSSPPCSIHHKIDANIKNDSFHVGLCFGPGRARPSGLLKTWLGYRSPFEPCFIPFRMKLQIGFTRLLRQFLK